MLSVGLIAVACVNGLLALDRIVGWALQWIAPILPRDYCGPDGWLVDTQQASGIFDRRAK